MWGRIVLGILRHVLHQGKIAEMRTGVNKLAFTQHLKMKVGAGGAPGGADGGERLAAIHAITDPDQDRLGMGIPGDDIAMGDFNHEAIAGLRPGMTDHAIAHGMDRRAQARGDPCHG